MAEASAPNHETIADYLEAGISAAQAGQRPLARRLLTRVIEQDERCVAAWLWLSRVVEEGEEQQICLENVLTLEPGNAEAQEGLARLREKMAPPPAAPLPERPPAAAPIASPAPSTGELPMPPLVNLADRYLCPYCAARTRFEQHRCPACGGKLWRRSRQQEERTQSRIGFVLGLQGIAAGLNAAAVVLLLLYVSRRIGYPGIVPMLGLYLGTAKAPPAVVNAALAVLPRLPIVILCGLLVLSLVVWLGIYLRWKPAFYLFLVSGIGLAIVGLLTTATLWPAVDLGDDVLNGLARIAMVVMDLAILGTIFALAMEMSGEFFIEQERIAYRLDPHAVEGIDFLTQGQRYAQERMWALAAIHFHRAVDGMSDNFEALLKLAATYGNLGRYEAAGRYLQEAARTRPGDARVQALTKWLAQRRPGSSLSGDR